MGFRAWGGAAAGAAIGSVVPVVGTLIGGLIGGALGAWGGGKLTDLDTYGVDDGVVFNPKDKFMKMNDGTMIAGTNKNGNKDLAKAILTSRAPGFNSSGYLANANRNTSFGSTTTNVKLSDLRIDGTIRLEMNGASTSIKSAELLNNKMFIRDLGLELNKAQNENMGKTK